MVKKLVLLLSVIALYATSSQMVGAEDALRYLAVGQVDPDLSGVPADNSKKENPKAKLWIAVGPKLGVDQAQFRKISSGGGVCHFQIAARRDTDQVIASISSIPLQTLEIRNAQISEQGVANIAKINTLKTLELRNTLVPVKAMGQLKKLTGVTHLGLCRLPFSPLNIQSTLLFFPQLKVLDLGKSTKIDRDYLLKNCPKLEKVVYYDEDSWKPAQTDTLTRGPAKK